MNKITYNFADTDIKTLICALTAYESVPKLVDNHLCESVISKLNKLNLAFSLNELRVMDNSLCYADLILKNDVPADSSIKESLAPYTSSINQLIQLFGSWFSIMY